MHAMISSAAALACIVGSWSPSTAHAFHGAGDFRKPAIDGGGDGSYFTGSPRFRGWDCTMCHVDAPGDVRFAVDAFPSGLLEGQYAPGEAYDVTVSLLGEHRGVGAPLNANTFAFEIVDEAATPVGLYVDLSANVERPSNAEMIVARGESSDQRSWSFQWIAPDAGAGALSMHIAGVDGDGAEGRLGRTGDPFGDDVYVAALSLEERGSPKDRSGGPIRGVVSCASSSATPGLPAAVVVAFLLRLRRSQRRRRRLIAR